MSSEIFIIFLKLNVIFFSEFAPDLVSQEVYVVFGHTDELLASIDLPDCALSRQTKEVDSWIPAIFDLDLGHLILAFMGLFEHKCREY